MCLPKSARLLADFARYCEIKRGCHHLSVGPEGAPRCGYQGSDGECRFEICPELRGS